MSRYRRAAKIDDSQPAIVRTLIAIPGITVALGHDDILVGYRGRTYWYEIKSKRAVRKDGTLRENAIEDSQAALLAGWRGHYRIVSSVEEIFSDLGTGEISTCGGSRKRNC